MVEIGAEYEGSPFYSPPDVPHMEKDPAVLMFSNYSGLGYYATLKDTSSRERDPDSMVACSPLRFGDESGPVLWPSVSDMTDVNIRRAGEKLDYRFMGKTYYKGKTSLLDGMFNSRDKLARIGVVATIAGVPLGKTDIILNGKNHREIVKTDHRGVWGAYLEIDNYDDALFISPNGIVYDMLKQVERLPDNEGIFDQVVRRRTIANATSRLFHRKFI